MQHLDEGMIHSWLDGALSADESARVEAHVKECPQCATAVAEARGFIAASSRILTALDNAPRGVIPVTAPGRRVDPIVWRIAATVLVVAAGTLAVFRNGAGTAKRDQMTVQTVPTASSVARPEISMHDQGAGLPGAPATPATKTAKPGPTTPARALSKPPAMEKRGAVGEVAASDQMTRSRNVPAAAPAAQTFAQTSGGAAMDAASEQPQALKVVGTPSTIGARVTLYEVSPGDTVIFTEPAAFQLRSAVVTGVAEGSSSRQAAGKAAAAAPMRRADAVSAPSVASANAQASRVESANGVTTIIWLDPVSGNMLRLSGRMPAARLQEIRLRIERERAAAAAAAAKKNP